MAPTPSLSKVPSEHTIEVLANHYLLNGISRARCWLFCPSTNEELLLGYDASAQNLKSLLIQYKALTYKSATSASIALDQIQHATLLANFPAKSWPYVFYGFCTHRTYAELDAGYKSPKAPEFFDNCLFIDAHSLPAGTSRLRYSFTANQVLPIVSNKATNSVPFIRGRELICGISSCSIGDRKEPGKRFSRVEHQEIHGRNERISGISVLKVPIG